MRATLFILFTAISFSAIAQKVDNLTVLKQKQPYDNTAMLEMYSDSMVTSTVIWIKKEVKPHYHADHTEQVYVIEGQGQMLVGTQTINVGPGDLVYIPKGTVHALRVLGKDKPMKVLSIQTPQFDGNDRVMMSPAGW